MATSSICTRTSWLNVLTKTVFPLPLFPINNVGQLFLTHCITVSIGRLSPLVIPTLPVSASTSLLSELKTLPVLFSLRLTIVAPIFSISSVSKKFGCWLTNRGLPNVSSNLLFKSARSDSFRIRCR